MALNKSVSAVPQVVNAVPAETYMGLYLRTFPHSPFLRHFPVLILAQAISLRILFALKLLPVAY
jgi:hypothetical protein